MEEIINLEIGSKLSFFNGVVHVCRVPGGFLYISCELDVLGQPTAKSSSFIPYEMAMNDLNNQNENPSILTRSDDLPFSFYLFVITRKANINYEENESMVICAKDEDTAMMVAKSNATDEGPIKWNENDCIVKRIGYYTGSVETPHAILISNRGA